jgi:xanthosine utilization system XapX-like protein
MLLGLGLGLLIAFFFTLLVANSPVTLPARRIFWLYLLSAASGVLVGLAIESIRQLQQSSPDPAYHKARESRKSR